MTDIRELKSVLSIDPDNTAEDKLLNFLIEQASSWIEEWLNRPGLSYRARTEYYNGTGTQKLLLRSRPVFASPTIEVYVQEGGYYGSTSGSFGSTTQLTYGNDFCLKIDQSDGLSSRCGILVRTHNYWPKPTVRQTGYLSPFIGEDFGSIKVIYYGGYTVDSMPAVFRFAMNTLVARMRNILPQGMELSGDGYEERNLSYLAPAKDYLLNIIKPIIGNYRNWKW